MADFRLCTRGGNREPFHAGALDERSGLVDIVPDGLVSAWYEDPATTVFQRVLGGEVKVMEVPAELYYDTEKRWSWKQVILKVNETHGGDHASGPFPPSLAKIDNWAALIPLPLVLEAFDRLYNEPLAPGLEARTHQVEAFALLLLDLGFAPGTTATACSSVQLTHMTQWLEVHCEHAVRLFLWSFAHVYVNARAAAAAAARHPVRWANRLRRLNISQGSPAWESYVRHLEANDGLRLANLFPRKASYFSGHVAPELLVSPVLTDLYLTLHPFKQRPPHHRPTSLALASPSLSPAESWQQISQQYHPRPRTPPIAGTALPPRSRLRSMFRRVPRGS